VIEANPHERVQRLLRDASMADLGEKAFVSYLLGSLPADPRLVTGRGDDAAVVSLPGGARLAFTIDKVAKPVALRNGWADARSWGALAVTANCSDVLASGGAPVAFVVSIALAPDTLATDAEAIVVGCADECERRGVVFAGGDTKESEDSQVVGSAIGCFGSNEPALSRRGARVGDVLVVSGSVGGFVGAASLLMSDVGAGDERQSWCDYLGRPEARWAEAELLRGQPPPHAAVDTSDGIYDALLELTRRGLGVSLDLARVPFHPFALRCARELRHPLVNFLLGGGDWNILYAFEREAFERIQLPDGMSLHMIGEFTSGREFIAKRGAELFTFRGPRNEHFRQRLEEGESFVDMVLRSTWFVPRDAS
jgi:thiamine-monophosphate kinase